jgi:hypothetical protein
MYKILLMSVLFAMIAIPSVASRDQAPRRGLRRAIFGMLVFNFVYMLALIFVYPRICW